LALIQAASGAAAYEAFRMTASSNEAGVAAISLLTLALSCGVTVRASKLMI